MLPNRPKPTKLPDIESLTGYLTKLGELNSFASVDEICNLLFSDRDRRVARELSDHEPLSFGKLPQKTGCSSDELKNLT
ncbi:MAG: hypothetical protein AAFY41_14855, partial [Bacteroidota bacterium]